MRQRKAKTARRQVSASTDLLSAPHNQIYLRRNAEEDALITTLMLAAEALAAPLRTPDAAYPDAPHATPESDHATQLDVDLSELLGLIEQFHALLVRDGRLVSLLARLQAAFQDRTTLYQLCSNLFPSLAASASRDGDGKSILSRSEVAVLREVAGDLSHEEIAGRLGIASQTVATHLKHVYKKLGVNRPIQAVARAIALGYLDMDAIGFINAASHSNMCGFRVFGEFIVHTVHNDPHAAALKLLAQLGLLISTLSGVAATSIAQDHKPDALCRGAVCEIDTRGEIVRVIGTERLHHALGIAIAPPDAARHGFTPGNLFVAHSGLPLQGLNDAEVAEFTPTGKFVRAFCGGNDIATRMDYPFSLAFTQEGSLLVTTGWLTDAILEFTEGGAKVRRFANGCSLQLCVAPSGRIYAVQYSGIGCIIKVFDSSGRLVDTIGGTSAGKQYFGLAIDARGHVFVTRNEQMEGVLEYDADGKLVRSQTVPGLCSDDICNVGLLAQDAQGRIYVPCQRSGDVKVLASDGEIRSQIDLRGKIPPYSVAVGDDGHLWISGLIP